MSTTSIVQKPWNYSNGPRLGQSLACSPAREYAGTREKPRLTLRDDGMCYGDYPSASLRAGSEQLTYLLFGFGITSRFARYEPAPQQAGTPACCLKMADERSRPTYKQASPVPAGYDCPQISPSLALPRKRERGFSWGDALFDHYRLTLEELGYQKACSTRSSPGRMGIRHEI